MTTDTTLEAELKRLNELTAAFLAAETAAKKADTEMHSARVLVNAQQERIDNMLAEMRNKAPIRTYWRTSKGERVSVD